MLAFSFIMDSADISLRFELSFRDSICYWLKDFTDSLLYYYLRDVLGWLNSLN